jgi:hypothetical protein
MEFEHEQLLDYLVDLYEGVEVIVPSRSFTNERNIIDLGGE